MSSLYELTESKTQKQGFPYLRERERELLSKAGLQWPALPVSEVHPGKRDRRFGPCVSKGEYLKVDIGYDDRCENGHNTFSITGEHAGVNDTKYTSYGCLHHHIEKMAPPCLVKCIKWHGMTTDGPLYYLINGYYHLGFGEYSKADEHAFKNHVVFGECPDSDTRANFIGCQMDIEFATVWMITRLPQLMQHFQADMQALDWRY